MKNKLFMYLFFFAILFILFQYMNEKSVFESQEKQINALSKQKKISDSLLNSSEAAFLAQNHFHLMNNDNAMSYLENLGMEAEDVMRLVQESIYEKNVLAGGNPLVPVDGVAGTMRINKVSFLNHRWVIADYTDGTYWGEVLIEYFFDENNQLLLKTIDAVLYP